MVIDGSVTTPVWTLGTEIAKAGLAEMVAVPEGGITSERLAQLREGLAAFMDSPLVSLEAYPLPAETRSTGGRLLDAASPLAQNLTSLIRQSSAISKVAPAAAAGGEVLYRMVVPAKVAAAMGTSMARSMPSAAAATGIHSAILGHLGIVGQATFVPVAAEAATVAGAGGVMAVGAGMITVAAPLVLLAIATAATVYAEEQRRRALRRITELLNELKQAQLEDERDALMASSKAIDKATAVLLDEGRIGHSLGLDSAVHTIDRAVEAATRRAENWQRQLVALGDSGASVASIKKAYPGIDHHAGEFRTQLRAAAFAVAMKRRVAVLQAVEHAQQASESTLPRFAAVLKSEQATVDELERQLVSFLSSLAHLKIKPSDRVIDKIMMRHEVVELLEWPTRLQQLSESESAAVVNGTADLEIAMIRGPEGSLRVLAPDPIG